jgi:predicted ABC-type transport system involved in lysophospholipase L1 biosynthesis ATPase subunit
VGLADEPMGNLDTQRSDEFMARLVAPKLVAPNRDHAKTTKYMPPKNMPHRAPHICMRSPIV